MKRLITSIVLASTMFSVGAVAQSAKFTAVYKDSVDSTFVRSEACSSTEENYCEALGLTDSDSNEVLAGFATIKVPQAKELLVGLSAQVALFTSTVVKGKRGTYSKAVASAEGGVTMYACDDGTCYQGAPGYVALSNRSQELEAILAGVIENCDVDVVIDVEAETASGSFTLADCDVLDEMIGLGITTMAAHHFNFVFPNLPQGEYTMIAKFQTEASAASEAWCYYDSEDLGCSDDDGSATGEAHAYIGKYMMTVQEVRAVKDENGSATEVEM